MDKGRKDKCDRSSSFDEFVLGDKKSFLKIADDEHIHKIGKEKKL